MYTPSYSRLLTPKKLRPKVGGKVVEQSMFQSCMECQDTMVVGHLKVADIWKMMEIHMCVSAHFISKMHQESLTAWNGDFEGYSN